jgi:adenylyltransferase/sulfurtransferase
MLPAIGIEGQRKLKDSSVCVIGVGGLGSPALLYLAAAGVGRIGIVDDDVVDITNLQRQVIHSTAAVGTPKVNSAAARLAELNPEIIVESHECRLKSDNAIEILSGYDVIVDGVDNIPTRYLLNDACEILSLPWVHASVFRFEGQLTTFNIADGPNYRDLVPTPPPAGSTPSCADAGVLGVLPGMMGILQATEVVKLLLGIGTPMSGRLLLFDALLMSFRELSFAAAPGRSIATTLAMDSDYELTKCDLEETRAVQSKSGLSDGPSRGGSAPDSASGEDRAGAVEANAEINDFTEQGHRRGRTVGKGMFGVGKKIGNLRPSEFVEKQDAGWNAFLLDVRGQLEANITSLPGTDLCLETQLVQVALNEIPRDRDVVVYCRSGHRSKVIAKALVKWGWPHENVWNLAGGVHAWSDEIDSSVPKY